MSTRAKASVLAASLALLATPGAAVTVEAEARNGILFLEDELRSLTTSERVDPEGAVSIEFGPDFVEEDGFGVVRAGVQLDGPGETGALGLGSVTITNLVDDWLNLDYLYFGDTSISITLDGSGDVGRARASTVLTVFFRPFRDIDSRLDASADDPNLAGCDDRFPCEIRGGSSGPNRLALRLELLPFETVPIDLIAFVKAEAIAPIPLPAAIGPAVLALGGLAWAGRRRSKGIAAA